MQHKIQWQLMRVKLERNEEIYELLKCHWKISITVKQIKYENENIIQQEVWTENIHWKIWTKIHTESQVIVN